MRELLAQQNLKLMGNQSYGSYYSTLVASVGNQTNTAQLQSAAMLNTLKQTTESLSNVTGVSLDQEAANLIKYQQSYQACSKVIQVAQTHLLQHSEPDGLRRDRCVSAPTPSISPA
ncbi:hypothetical protein JOS77_31165 [Chromobacterium haemolyticum]|nr:hypothetical protein JOS77_31165 [Chromobacterium haemolyticum]